mmetsp:Transcript_27160/g.60102  ORF Transcript_27160/g.60102 Transcript_27160/m.60102 type:complete len:208 (-) Transcript_27160:1332-1955(-)
MENSPLSPLMKRIASSFIMTRFLAGAIIARSPWRRASTPLTSSSAYAASQQGTLRSAAGYLFACMYSSSSSNSPIGTSNKLPTLLAESQLPLSTRITSSRLFISATSTGAMRKSARIIIASRILSTHFAALGSSSLLCHMWFMVCAEGQSGRRSERTRVAAKSSKMQTTKQVWNANITRDCVDPTVMAFSTPKEFTIPNVEAVMSML